MHRLSKTDINNIIQIIRKNSSTNKPTIVFYGGEPLLEKELFEYTLKKTSCLAGFKFNYYLSTNGSLIDNSIIQLLKKYNVKVNVSLDGTRSLHNKTRRFKENKNTFDKVIKGIKLLVKNNVKTSISCTVSKFNYKKLCECIKFFKSLNIKSIGFNILVGNKDISLKPEQYAKVLFDAYKYARKLGMSEERIGNRFYSWFLEEKPKKAECAACGKQITFTPLKTISTCHSFFYFKKFQTKLTCDFNVNSDQIIKKWLNLTPFTMKKCKKCPAIGLCGGGCYLNNYLLFGRMRRINKDWCVFVNKVLERLIDDYYENEIKNHSSKRISIP
jgi:uncharacterized protein